MLLIKEKKTYIIWSYSVTELYNRTKPNPYSIGKNQGWKKLEYYLLYYKEPIPLNHKHIFLFGHSFQFSEEFSKHIRQFFENTITLMSDEVMKQCEAHTNLANLYIYTRLTSSVSNIWHGYLKN